MFSKTISIAPRTQVLPFNADRLLALAFQRAHDEYRERSVMEGLTLTRKPYFMRAGPEQEAALCELAPHVSTTSAFVHIPELQVWLSQKAGTTLRAYIRSVMDIDLGLFHPRTFHVYTFENRGSFEDDAIAMAKLFDLDPDLDIKQKQYLIEMNIALICSFPSLQIARSFLNIGSQFSRLDKVFEFHQVLPHGFMTFRVQAWPKAIPYVERVCAFLDAIECTVIVNNDVTLKDCIEMYVKTFNEEFYGFFSFAYRPYARRSLSSNSLN